MTTQHDIKFCNATSIIGNNNTLTRGDTNYQAKAILNKTAWGDNQNAQIGGMTFIATVTTALTAAMNCVVSLATNTTNTLAGGTYIANLSIPNNQTAGYTVSTVIPKGKTRLAYLGVVVVGSGNIAAGNVTAYLSAAQAQIID